MWSIKIQTEKEVQDVEEGDVGKNPLKTLKKLSEENVDAKCILYGKGLVRQVMKNGETVRSIGSLSIYSGDHTDAECKAWKEGAALSK